MQFHKVAYWRSQVTIVKQLPLPQVTSLLVLHLPPVLCWPHAGMHQEVVDGDGDILRIENIMHASMLNMTLT